MREEHIRNFRHATFAELHDDGAERFGLLWLTVNQDVIRGALAAGMDPYTAENKRTLSVIAYVLCLALAEKRQA